MEISKVNNLTDRVLIAKVFLNVLIQKLIIVEVSKNTYYLLIS